MENRRSTRRLPLRGLLVLPLVTLIFLAVQACGSDTPSDPPPAETGSIAGTVQDEAGAGVTGATVSAAASGQASRTATSGANGAFSFSNLPVGSWQVSVTPPTGYEAEPSQTQPVSATVTSNGTAQVALRVRRIPPPTTGTITGTVANGSGGVGGATLTLTGSGNTLTTTSSATGTYSFTGLEVDDYTVTITPPSGFVLAQGESAAKPAVVSTAGQTVTVNFSVTPTQGAITVIVNLVDFAFQGPGGQNVTIINVGTTIRWVAVTGGHTITPDGNTEWVSQDINNAGEVFEHTFNTAGDFAYFCAIHRSVGMTGTIVVQ